MSAWTKFVTDFYKKEHAKNPDYKFKTAMKDAAKVYKKSASEGASGKTMKKSRKSRKSRKARKSRKH